MVEDDLEYLWQKFVAATQVLAEADLPLRERLVNAFDSQLVLRGRPGGDVPGGLRTRVVSLQQAVLFDGSARDTVAALGDVAAADLASEIVNIAVELSRCMPPPS